MSHYVKIASVQFRTIAQEGQQDAREIILRETAETLRSLEGYGLDLVVFSEMVEYWGQRLEDAETVEGGGPLLDLYSGFARSQSCHVAGSVKLADGGRVYNAIAFIGPSGEVLGAYCKNNLTIGEIEGGLASGRNAVVVDTAIGRLGGAICFDLNFEGLRQEYRRLRPDIMVFASAYHGGLMQGLWAYDCRAYFVSALPMTGSGILDPFGRPVALTDPYSPVAMARVNLDRAMVHLDYNHVKFSDIRKKYLDEVVVDIPPHIGPALIYSLTDKRTAMDVVREFELELIDDYFERSLEANAANR